MTEIYDRRANQSRASMPRLQLLPEVGAVCSQRQDNSRRAGAARAHLRALQRNDDAENALQYFRAPDHRSIPSIRSSLSAMPIRNRPPAFSSARSLATWFRWMKTSRRSRCAVSIEQFQFSAHASRESIVDYVKSLRRKNRCWCMAMCPRWNGFGRGGRGVAAEEMIVPTPGVEIEL